jgi:hypothetical protein
MSDSDAYSAFVAFVRTKATNAAEATKRDMGIWKQVIFNLRLWGDVTGWMAHRQNGCYVDSAGMVRRWCVYGAYMVRINSALNKNEQLIQNKQGCWRPCQIVRACL